jgi:hypothetical protein
MTRVTTAELRNAADMLFAHLESNGIAAVAIEEDYYWDVPVEARYDKYKEPKKHTIGQLSDDVAEVKRMLKGDVQAVGYGLVWLAAVLRRVGETANC